MTQQQQIPTIGRIVHYSLSAQDIKEINHDRAQITANPGVKKWVGNPVNEGQLVPMLIVVAWGTTPESAVNGLIFLDGPLQTIYRTSRSLGDQPGSWRWPAIVGVKEHGMSDHETHGDYRGKTGTDDGENGGKADQDETDVASTTEQAKDDGDKGQSSKKAKTKGKH